MKSSTVVWLLLVILGGGFLAMRASSGRMGQVYVRDVTVAPPETDIQWTKQLRVDPRQRDEADVRFSWSRTIGLWVAALCTLAIMSFLYGDNPLYKLAEAVFVGSSAGYAMAVGFWDGIMDILMKNLAPGLMRATVFPTLDPSQTANLLFLIPLILGIAMLWRLSPVGGWISRWPLAFFIGATAGLRLIVHFESDFIRQIQGTIFPLIVLGAGGTFENLLASLKNLTILIGMLSCIAYFFFSVEHTGTFGAISRLGIWFLMITFGAGFGFTVMGRIALLSGRLEFLFDDWLWLIDPIGKRLGM